MCLFLSNLPIPCFKQMTLECLGMQSNLGVCVCQMSSLYVLWPAGFVFVMWQDSDRVMAHHVLCLHLFVCVCVCIQLGDTAAFIAKNFVFPPARPSSPQSLSSFFPSLPLKQDLCSSPCSFHLRLCIILLFKSVLGIGLFVLFCYIE